ncbi:hypothetical protein F5884DRAFT_830552 [Xylogone sp. PMI_703]|nr:hypothetical protein F5884DRAFT_830552 [Xylogone sp. PMI_703]
MQKRKRSIRAKVACESCRRLKLKCDQQLPCSVCSSNYTHCMYRPVPSNAPGGRHNLRPILSHQDTASWTENSQCPRCPLLSHEVNFSSHHRETVAEPAPAPRSRAEDDVQETRSRPAPQAEDDRVVESRSKGFEEINEYTDGREFYGPAATLAFLQELRARARSLKSKLKQIYLQSFPEDLDSTTSDSVSIINFFHGSSNGFIQRRKDFPSNNGCATGERFSDMAATRTRELGLPPSIEASGYMNSESSAEIEGESIRLYFTNLHLIYCILDQDSFIRRCEADVWAPIHQSVPKQLDRRRSRFLALYYAVVALGLLTAGDDMFAIRTRFHISRRLGRSSETSWHNPLLHPPLELAETYFTKAKSLLGDLFESSSLETMQTLFLMSIFCQYALNPHGSYMYSGMSVRTALAMGITEKMDLSKISLEAWRTWWNLYYHEMEVCCSLGRESSLREPSYYPVYIIRFPDPVTPELADDDAQGQYFRRAMISLAEILRQASEEIYHSPSNADPERKIMAAVKLDESLLRWKSQVSPIFELDSTPLTEKESTTKRKLVIKLRYYSVRILIHRPFLVASALQQNMGNTASVNYCIEASQKTIQLLYDTFVTRPFFRTWWYNTSYAFNAITVILYALVAQLNKADWEGLLTYVEKCLAIFSAMNEITVAQRCAELTREIYDVARFSLRHQQACSGSFSRNSMPEAASEESRAVTHPVMRTTPAQPSLAGTNGTDSPAQDMPNPDEYFTGLLNPNVWDIFDNNLLGLE